MTGDLLNHPQRNSGIAHLGEGSAAEGISTYPFDANPPAHLSQNPTGRIRMQMPFPVPSWKQESLWLGRVILLQPDSEIFNHRDGSRCQLAFGVTLADHHLWAHSALTVVHISRLQGDAFVDAADCIQTDSEQGTVSQREERKWGCTESATEQSG